MAIEEADPGALKRNVLHLVLQHPEGVTFGDFSGAFKQLHGYHPHLALHGYRSLKDLVADMKNVVVLEGDSQNPVIKLASESLLYRWLEGGEEYGWDDSEEEAQSSSYDEAATEEDAEVLELLTSLLSSYKFGLKIKRVQKFLLAKDGVDLEKFSIAQGYKDTLEFLEHRIPELTIKNPEKGLNCVVRLTADTAGEMQPPVSSSSCKKVLLHAGLTISSSCPSPLQDLSPDASQTAQNPEPPRSSNYSIPQGSMAVEEADPGALKRNVLHLVLQHPEGVKFGEFSGAFKQLHGYHPHLALHGYRSLKDLVADMKNFVVLKGDSQNPVIKLASESLLYRWLEGGEEYGWDDSEEEAQSSSYDEAAAEEDADTSAPFPSVITQGLLGKPASQAPGFSIAFVTIRDVLKCHPKGLKVKKLKEALREKYDIDLEMLRSDLGYQDIVSFLQGMPGLLLRNSNAVRNCVVQLQSGPSSPAPSLDTDFSACNSNATFQEPMKKKSVGTLSSTPSLDTDSCTCNSNAIPQRLMTKKSDLATAIVLVLDVLGDYPLGLNPKALKENLEMKHGFDLDAFSQELGYEDVMSCLVDIPGLCISYLNGRPPQNCIIQLLPGAPVLPAWLVSASYSLDKPPSSSGSNTLCQKPMERKAAFSSASSQFSASLSFSKWSTSKSKTLNQSEFEKKPASCISTSTPVSAPLSVDSKQSSINSETSNQRKVEKTPALAEVLALLSSLLSSTQYQSGLRLKKVQELLLTKEGVDLEKFSIAQGHKDSLAFLERHMPQLKIKYQEDRLSCVLQLESDSGVNSVRPLLNAPPPCVQAASSVPASCVSTSTPVCAPLSVHSKPSSIKSETSNQRKVEKTPALAEVLALLSSLLSSKGYELGLKLKKVQELLLTKDGVDLKRFSIAQGYKDSLAFLERHMPQLTIRYQEDPLSCVLQLGSGSCAQTSPPLLSAPTSLMQTTKTVLTANSVPASCISTSTPISAPLSLGSKPSSIKSETSNQRKVEKTPALSEVLALLSSLLSTSQYQSGLRLAKVQELLLTKDGVDLKRFSIAQGYKDSLAFLERHMPQLTIRYQEDPLSCVLQLGSAKAFISQNPHGAFSDKDRSSSQPPSDISSQLSSEFQFHRPPPAEELPTLPNVQLLRRPNLTEPLHSKDLDELKQEVAHILARHPEGISLFQFRVEYSNAYQKHLPLEDASSAKQRLLQMPDVVCLKGYGVQTLLFPVSAKEPSLKSGQQIISRVEDAAVVPYPSLSKAVVDPVVVCQPALPTAPVKPWPRTIHSLTSGHLSEPGNTESSVLPPSELLRAPKPRALLQEHRMAKLGDLSGQSCLSHAAEAAVAPDCSLSKTDPVVVPMSSAPKATMAPVPQPRSSSHLYSECFKPPSNKESCPHPETSPRRAPKTVVPEEERETTRARPRGTLPSPPVVFPPDWDAMSDGFASSPTHQAKPGVSHKRTLTPSLSQPLPASFMTWAQPLVFPHITFLKQPVSPPSLAFQPVPITPPRIQPPNVKPQSSHLAQAVPQMRPHWPTSPLQSTEQRNYVYAAQGPGAFSQEQMSSRTAMHAQNLSPVFVVDGMPVPSPSQNPPSAHASKSQTTYQPECYRRPWLDSPQCSSISAVDNSAITTSSARLPSQPAVYWSQSAGGNTLVTSPSTPPSHMLPVPTNVSQQPSYASSRTSTHTEALPSSALRSSPQPFQPHLSISNRDPQAFTYPQQYVDVCSTVSSVTTRPASSLTSPLYSPTDTSGLPSYTSYNATRDYGAPNQMKPLLATSKEAENQDNHYVTWVDKQKPGHLTQRPTNSYSSAFQNSPPPKSPSKCVIL